MLRPDGIVGKGRGASRWRTLGVLVAFVASASCGCTDSAPPNPAVNPAGGSGGGVAETDPLASVEDSSPRMVIGSGRAAAAVAAGEVTLRDVDGAAFRDAIAAHTGKIVLIDMWATWCIPCRERFPHIVELSRSAAGQGLAVISLSMDEPSERESVLEFLTEQNARFENMIGTYGLGTEATEEFEYPGELPFYKLYDRQGALRYQFSGDPRDEIEPLDKLDERVSELLAEGA